MINVMVCDDIDEICEHFCSLINSQDDMTVVCRAHSRKEAVDLALKYKPDIILMDIQMDSKDAGLLATKEICETLTKTKIIMLTIHNNSDIIVDTYLANAVDYILKSSDPETIFSSVRKAFYNENYIGKLINDTLKKSVGYSKKRVTSLLYIINHISTLTSTELRILKYLCNNTKRAKIADLEFISENTLKLHIKHILRKLNFSTCREMTKFLNELDIMDYIGNTDVPKQ